MLLGGCNTRIGVFGTEEREIRLMDGAVIGGDGSMEPDAGGYADGGSGPDPTPDAGSGTDAGTGYDAGPPPIPDAGYDAGSDPDPLPGCGNATEMAELELTNAARVDAGLVELVCDDALTRAARLHSQDMCDLGYFSHTSADGRNFGQRLVEQGATFGAAGENIAWGQSTPAAVHSAWMGSSGHRANILGSRYRRIGIGYVNCSGRPYWTQDFTD